MKRVVAEYSDQIGIDSAHVRLENVSIMKDMTALAFQPTVNGVPVEFATSVLRIWQGGKIDLTAEKNVANIICPTTPSLDASTALEIAKKDFGDTKAKVRFA